MQADLIARRNVVSTAIEYVDEEIKHIDELESTATFYTKLQESNKLKQQLLQKQYNAIDELIPCAFELISEGKTLRFEPPTIEISKTATSLPEIAFRVFDGEVEETATTFKSKICNVDLTFNYDDGEYIITEAVGEFQQPSYDYYPMFLSDGTGRGDIIDGREVWLASDLQDYIKQTLDAGQKSIEIKDKYFKESLDAIQWEDMEYLTYTNCKFDVDLGTARVKKYEYKSVEKFKIKQLLLKDCIFKTNYMLEFDATNSNEPADIEILIIDNCQNIKALNLKDCENMSDISIENTNINIISIYYANKINFKNSQFNKVEYCWLPNSNIDISNLTNVEYISIVSCNSLTSLNLSPEGEKLVHYTISKCDSLKTLTLKKAAKYIYLDTLKALTTVVVSGEVYDIYKIATCKALEEIILDNNPIKHFENYDYISKRYITVPWKKISLKNCYKLEELLISSQNITDIDLSECVNLTTLNLSECTNLTTLDLSGCTKLITLDLSGCTNLTTLDLSGWANLTTLDLSGCTKLITLNLSGCTELKYLYTNYDAPLRYVTPDTSTKRIASDNDIKTILSIEAPEGSGCQILINYDFTNNNLKQVLKDAGKSRLRFHFCKFGNCCRMFNSVDYINVVEFDKCIFNDYNTDNINAGFKDFFYKSSVERLVFKDCKLDIATIENAFRGLSKLKYLDLSGLNLGSKFQDRYILHAKAVLDDLPQVKESYAPTIILPKNIITSIKKNDRCYFKIGSYDSDWIATVGNDITTIYDWSARAAWKFIIKKGSN